MLSNKTKYALKALQVLAKEYGQGPVLISEIARRENIGVVCIGGLADAAWVGSSRRARISAISLIRLLRGACPTRRDR